MGVDTDWLHVGDWVWMGDRRLRVHEVNRDDRRVLVGGRKKYCNNSIIGWVEASDLSNHPENLDAMDAKSILELRGEIAEAINWIPHRRPLPTKAMPGTLEKIEVIRLRVEHGEDLWHPEDAPNDFR